MVITNPLLTMTTPFTMIISGQSGSGKTEFVRRLLENQHQLFVPNFDRIIYAYSIMQDVYVEMQKVNSDIEFIEGFPDDLYDRLLVNKKNTMLVLDDLMLELADNKKLPKLFTMMRHNQISTVFIVQNFYFNSKYMTTVTRNSHYIVLFPNPRDMTMVRTLGKQMFPSKPKFLEESFIMATKKKYGYLFIDLKPDSDERCKLREAIFPGELCVVYRPR